MRANRVRGVLRGEERGPRDRDRDRAATALPGAAAAPVQGDVGMHRRILIIDDDPAVHDVVRPSLEADGYAVESAFDGARGLRLSAAGAWPASLARAASA